MEKGAIVLVEETNGSIFGGQSQECWGSNKLGVVDRVQYPGHAFLYSGILEFVCEYTHQS
jgi:hypothetical protein